MMEAMPMVSFGPAGFGPGAGAGGGCDFRCSLSSGLSSRMNTEQLLKIQALDLATAKSELKDADPIGIYRLRVGEATFRHKSTGEIITEKTLISPDFNDEAIGVWTDAGEHGTGTAEEYTAILSRARELANTKGEATMVWVRPGIKKDSGLPENRAYVWKKHVGGNVTAYSYQLTGSTDSLKSFLGNLTKQKTESKRVDTQTLLFDGPDKSLSHRSIFDAYVTSLTREEKQESTGFIQKFESDTTVSDAKRWEKVESYKTEYEIQLREAYVGDIASAVEKIAQGFLALPFVSEVLPQRQEQPIGVPIQDQIEQISQLLRESGSNQFQTKEQQVVSSQDTIRTLVPIVTLSEDTEKDSSPNFINASRETSTHYIQETLKPLVPAVITVLSLLASGETVRSELLSEGSAVKTDIAGSVLFSKSDTSSDGIVVDRMDDTQDVDVLNPEDIFFGNVSDEMLPREIWQNFFVLLFSPNEQDKTDIILSDEEDREEESVLLSDVGMEQLPEDIVGNAFEHLALLLSDTEEEGERIPREVTTEVVDIAKDILILLLSEKNHLDGQQEKKSSTYPESEMYLSLFLSLYTDKKTTPEMKELFALFLYEEMKTLGKEHTFSVLYEPLFEKKKALVSDQLWQLLFMEIKNNTYAVPESRPKIEALLFLLYALHKNEPEKISSLIVAIEQLKHSVSAAEKGRKENISDYLYQMERILLSRQKKNRRGAKTGIIYWFWQNEYYRLISLSLPVVNGVEM